MMDNAALIEELKQLIITECDKETDPAEVDPEAQLIGGGALDLDSLDGLQIALAVKERYGVRIEGGLTGARRSRAFPRSPIS